MGGSALNFLDLNANCRLLEGLKIAMSFQPLKNLSPDSEGSFEVAGAESNAVNGGATGEFLPGLDKRTTQ